MNEDIERFDLEICSGGGMECFADLAASPDGDWVEYEAYEKLLVAFEQLRGVVRQLRLDKDTAERLAVAVMDNAKGDRDE